MDEGKTTLALWLARQRHTCVVVFDPRSHIDGHIVMDAEELDEAMQDEEIWRGRYIVYRYDMASADADEAFAEMMSVLWKYGGYGLVVDESAELQTWASIDKRLKKTVAQHIKRPAERSVTVIQTNHRLPEYNGKVKTVMAELYTFRTNNPRDLDLLVDYTGDAELPEVVRALPKHHCVRIKLARQDGGVPQWEIWDDPSKWYLPIEPPVNIPVKERSFMDKVERSRSYGERPGRAVDTRQTA